MVFAILAKNEDAMRPLIENAFIPHWRLKIGPGHWFVSMAGTNDDVWERLGLGDDAGDKYTSVIIPVTAYTGWADLRVWEWLASRLHSNYTVPSPR